MAGPKISPMGPGKKMAMPPMGGPSAVGPSGAAPKPMMKKKNTRDYGKKEPPAPMMPSPSPFGGM